MIFPRVFIQFIGLVMVTSVFAQAPATAKKNLVRNGGFESATKSDGLFSGVTNTGYLAGNRLSVPVLTRYGNISDSAMPVSVAAADMNNDGLMDIVTADPYGYIRIYFNKGTKEEPKFTVGEFINAFVGWGKDSPRYISSPRVNALRAPRIGLGDINGRKSIFIGNYEGNILLLSNMGNPMTPDFRQPQDLEKITISTMKDPKKRWGNVFAPVVYDWNADGKIDLILGEGSYSVNNIHLLINQGSSLNPQFNEDNRWPIAFGDGDEQLSPAIVDYNNDGKPDLLVGNRDGQITLYLNSGKPWAPGVDLEKKGVLKSGAGSVEEVTKGTGTIMRFGGICTVAAADFTGDGLFDLIVGKTSGRIAFVKNIGTPGSPKWQAPVDIKATEPGPATFRPLGWVVNTGMNRGNFLGNVEVVKEETFPGLAPPEGKASLRFYYEKSPNQIMNGPNVTIPSVAKFNPQKDTDFGRIAGNSGNNIFLVYQDVRMKPNVNYTLSFRIKGQGAVGAFAGLWVRGHVENKNAKITATTSRGGVTVEGKYFTQYMNLPVPFTPGRGWSEIKKDIKVTFNEEQLNNEPINVARLYFYVPLSFASGELFIDDVSLVEK